MGKLASALQESFKTHGSRKAIAFPEYKIRYTYNEHVTSTDLVMRTLPDFDNCKPSAKMGHKKG